MKSKVGAHRLSSIETDEALTDRRVHAWRFRKALKLASLASTL